MQDETNSMPIFVIRPLFGDFVTIATFDDKALSQGSWELVSEAGGIPTSSCGHTATSGRSFPSDDASVMFHRVFSGDLESGSEHELMPQRMNQHERYGPAWS